MAQEYVKPKGCSHLWMTVQRTLLDLSFILTVNLNLEEVQCIPLCVFYNKSKVAVTEIKLSFMLDVRKKEKIYLFIKSARVTLSF